MNTKLKRKILNIIYYYWKRNNWMLKPKSYFGNFGGMPINGPIFLLGSQGDGLTLLSRMLRRHPSVISATGNSGYWTGADEMQNVYEPILPFKLSGIRFNAPGHNRLTPPRSWSYACNEMIGHYRNTEDDIEDRYSKQLIHTIGLAIFQHGKNIENPRFVDKSQVYTVKMSFIYGLLSRFNPYFIFVTRNPYASIYRAAIGKAGDMKRYAKYMNLDERMRICIEHWLNSIKCIEEDKLKVHNFMSIRFEDLLQYPQKIVKQLCDFIELEYSDDLIPQPHHKLPFGMKYTDRWHPLRSDVNEPYLNEISNKYIDMIHEHCGERAAMYGYSEPKK